MKFRTKTKDYHLVIKARAAFREKIDQEGLEQFAQANIQGFFKLKMIKKRHIEYMGIPGMPLSEYLREPISKHEFFIIAEQLVLAARHLWENGFSTENLVSDICHVYINKMTKEIQLIYLPTLPNKRQNSFMELMEAVVYAVRSSGEDMEYLSRFIYFLRSLGSIHKESMEKLGNYITSEKRSVKPVLSERGISPEYKNPMDRQEEAGEDGVTVFEADVWEDSDEDQTEVVNEERYLFQQGGKSLSLDKYRPDYKSLSHESQVQSRNGGIDDEDDRTMMLDEDETEETDFVDSFQDEIFRMPVLYRISTGETIHITKKVFRLGKEEACVDYAVLNNHAVSRSHADIICRENRYFVFDLGSKNKSYINNRALPSQYEVEINNGDILKLANEEFEFRW